MHFILRANQPTTGTFIDFLAIKNATSYMQYDMIIYVSFITKALNYTRINILVRMVSTENDSLILGDVFCSYHLDLLEEHID